MTSTFLTAEWRKLIMAQYEIDPALLESWLPRGVELDLYHDGQRSRCYVSLVGFLFDRVRLKGIAIPFHTSFEEVNLRFYVVRKEADGTRKRGVVFLREFVPRAAIALVASSLYEEPYATVPMHHSIESAQDSLEVRYAWRSRAVWHRLEVQASPEPQPIAPGSEKEFLTEHYWGYTKRSRGSTSEYGVFHPRWSVYPIRNFKIVADFAALYGEGFAPLNGRAPVSVLLAEGSAVSVLDGTRLAD
jgi:uncharacterized protein